jgi:hypothetical protein
VGQKCIYTTEIDLFYNTKIKVTETTDPLEFFKIQHQADPKKFFHLTKLSKMLFCIPASSVPSESLFSRTDDITTDDRNRLAPQLVESITMIKENISYNN